MEHVPATDRLWAVLRPEVLDDATLRLCSCACVRHAPLADGRTVWDLLDDPRSRNAVEVAERYANGQATDNELAAAGYAARLCAWEAAGDAWDAAWAAAGAAARDAAWDAARAAAWDAAWDAARAAARAAAWDAARAAAWAAARDAAGAAQIAIVRDVINRRTKELVGGE